MKKNIDPIRCPKCKDQPLSESKVYYLGDEEKEVRLICLKCHTEYEPEDMKRYWKQKQDSLEEQYLKGDAK